MDKAIFWIACGPEYVAEARQSAKSARRHMPDTARVLITDKDAAGGVFDSVVVAPRHPGPWYLDSVRYFNYAVNELSYKRLICLDTDTHVCAPLHDVFAMLGRFDFVGAHAPARRTGPTVSLIPDAFPEFNIGMLAFRNSEGIRALFADWLDLYEKNGDLYGNNDQAPLREAIWEDKRGLQFYVLPPEYNCRFRFGVWAKLPIKVLHGRARDIGAVAKIVNQQKGFRMWGIGELK